MFGGWGRGTCLVAGGVAHVWWLGVWHMFGGWGCGTCLVAGGVAHVWWLGVWHMFGRCVVLIWPHPGRNEVPLGEHRHLHLQTTSSEV